MVIAVDFDGCLCENAWPGIGAPNEQLISWLIHSNCRLILWTCREGAALAEAVAWCAEHGLHFDAVNANLPDWIEKYGNDCRKVGADIYLDDKAVTIAARRRSPSP